MCVRILNLEKIDFRKFFGTVIGGVLFLGCVLFFTYAYYSWKSENTSVILGIEELSTSCELGTGVNTTNIGPVLDYKDGSKFNFIVQNGTSSSSTVPLTLNITSISSNLLVDSFKYILVRDANGGTNYDYDTPIKMGDFASLKVGSNVIDTGLVVDANKTYSYQFIVYIDGNMYNNSNMQENSLVGSLELGDCNITQKVKLSEVAVGSYVAYTGNNGCEGEYCSGKNANSDSVANGTCSDNASETFIDSGWKIAYVEDGIAHLISGGAPVCSCSDFRTDVILSASTTIPYCAVGGRSVFSHLDDLNNVALKFCNSNYTYNNVCDSSSVWAMTKEDIEKTGQSFSVGAYIPAFSRGNIWIASLASSSSMYVYNNSLNSYGVVPIIKLAPTVYITGGTGTSNDPYTIAND